jgi:sulfoacetaldehyde acetyltransferase
MLACYAKIVQTCFLQEVQARSMEQLTRMPRKAIDDQMMHGKTTLIEVMTYRETDKLLCSDVMESLAGVVEPYRMVMHAQGV